MSTETIETSVKPSEDLDPITNKDSIKKPSVSHADDKIDPLVEAGAVAATIEPLAAVGLFSTFFRSDTMQFMMATSFRFFVFPLMWVLTITKIVGVFQEYLIERVKQSEKASALLLNLLVFTLGFIAGVVAVALTYTAHAFLGSCIFIASFAISTLYGFYKFGCKLAKVFTDRENWKQHLKEAALELLGATIGAALACAAGMLMLKFQGVVSVIWTAVGVTAAAIGAVFTFVDPIKKGINKLSSRLNRWLGRDFFPKCDLNSGLVSKVRNWLDSRSAQKKQANVVPVEQSKDESSADVKPPIETTKATSMVKPSIAHQSLKNSDKTRSVKASLQASKMDLFQSGGWSPEGPTLFHQAVYADDRELNNEPDFKLDAR